MTTYYKYSSNNGMVVKGNGSFPHYFYQGDNFCDCFVQPIPVEKGSTLKLNYLLPSRIFPF